MTLFVLTHHPLYFRPSQWPTISEGAPSPRTELLHNIDPMGLEEDPVTGTKQAALRKGPWKILVGNPSQNLNQNGWVPPPTEMGARKRRGTGTGNGRAVEQQQGQQQGLAPPCAPCTFARTNLTTGVCLFNVEEDPEEVCRGSIDRSSVGRWSVVGRLAVVC